MEFIFALLPNQPTMDNEILNKIKKRKPTTITVVGFLWCARHDSNVRPAV